MKISRIMMTILLIFTIWGTCGCNKEKEEQGCIVSTIQKRIHVRMII